jgi:hypothetical protein
MSGSIIPAANQINAEVSGMTTNQVQLPTAHSISPSEFFAEHVSTNVGGLGYLFGHNITQAVSVPLEKATDSIQTNLGGFIRSARSFVQDHPLITDGNPFAGTPATPVTPTVTDTLRQQLNKLRNFVGM